MIKNICALLLIAMLGSCEFIGERVEGNGNVTKAERNETGFKSIDVRGSFDVIIKQSPNYKVQLEMDNNLLNYVETRLEGDKLIVKFQDNLNISTKNNLKVYVEMPVIDDLDMSGNGELKTEGVFTNSQKISLDISGSGNITMQLKAPKVEVDIAGSGTARLEGETKDLDIDIAGSGDYLSENLKSENASVSIAGSGTAKLFASSSLDVSIAGSGDVYYHGDPTIKQGITGSGNIRKLP